MSTQSEFREVNGQVTLIDGDVTLTCPVEDFQAIEPDYIGLPSGMIRRVWTPEQAFVSDGSSQHPDNFDGTGYLANIEQYQEALAARQWRYIETHTEDVLIQEDASILEVDSL